MKVLLVTPPFSGLNTPYPATCYLTGYLKSKKYDVNQKDLGIIVINKIFSKGGLNRIFTANSTGRIGALKDSYIKTIEPVMHFLQGKNPTLANRIVNGDFLPQSDRFDNLESEKFGELGLQDHARYLSTLYLNDIADYITGNIDHNFGFSRYSERLGLSPASFNMIEEELTKKNSLVTEIILEEWLKLISEQNYDLIGITIPFPGNLISTLQISKYTKKILPNTNIVIGGGWVNTELRSLSDPKLFNYVDYVILDDGEKPLEMLLKYLESNKKTKLHRTFIKQDGIVILNNDPEYIEIKSDDLPAPDYTGLDLTLYISLLDTLNPMHSLWNNGRWNKLTLAHGCYWKKCAFCDTTLPYISDFDQSKASSIADKIEKLILETGETGFHFVDEAAPPALLKELSLEILRRGLSITWWTNIRFEKNFTRGLAKIMAKSGCIGLSGGIEVASDRLLKLMNKGVTVEQVAQVTGAFGQEGIMVHAYLMYGFPTQTINETIDSLEVIRQFFKLNLVQSAYWHQFSLTAHSSVGKNPKSFGITIDGPVFGGFAQNDLEFSSNMEDPNIFSTGLKTSLYNYMRGMGLDLPLSTWFNFSIPKTRIKRDFLKNLIQNSEVELKDTTQIIWLGNEIGFDEGEIYLYDNIGQESLRVDKVELDFITELIKITSYKNKTKTTLADVDIIAEKYNIDPDFWLSQESANLLFNYGLVLI